MKEAMLYTKLGGDIVKCNLCSHHCKIAESRRGICEVRENRNGVLYTLVYGKAVARHVDPVEKKPLFHFYPGSLAYSIATVGCNFRCLNCQNFKIAQMPKEKGRIIGEEASPEEIVRAAKRYRCQSIAYTYTEPTIFFEYAYETAKIAYKEGLKNIFITGGYITEEALREIAPYLDAANIDLKSFSDEFYRRVCGARLKPVLDAIKLHKELGIWIEVTTLIIPTMNDSRDELTKIAKFVSSVGEEIPWHVSRFFPAYKLKDMQLTPVETLRDARKIGFDAGLRYVYEGNVPGEGENTYCYNCGRLLIHRYGHQIISNHIKRSRCPYCSAKIDGVLT